MISDHKPRSKVWMVCAGNICRSPMAEAVVRRLVGDAGLDNQITVDSAGTESYHAGQHAHNDTLRTLARNGISDYNGRARQITRSDLQNFDYIAAMDDDNLSDIKYLGGGRAKIARLLDYAPEQPVREVPDPYYNGGFERVYDLVVAGSRSLLAQIRADHHL